MSRQNLLCLFLFISTTLAASSCSSNNKQALEDSILSEISTPDAYGLSGSGSHQVGIKFFIFANSAGTVTAANCAAVATFADPYLPLTLLSTGAFADTLTSGTCTTVAPMVSSIAGLNGDAVTAEIGATGCTDQAVLNIKLDTSKLMDQKGNSGTDAVALIATIDLAPKVATVATGNTLATGTGTTEGSPGVFSIANDHAIVVTFSKSLASGTLSASISGCTAALGAGTVVLGTNGLTVAWPPTGYETFMTGQTCTLNVSGVKDAAGNPDDPADTNLSMLLTFGP